MALSMIEHKMELEKADEEAATQAREAETQKRPSTSRERSTGAEAQEKEIEANQRQSKDLEAGAGGAPSRNAEEVQTETKEKNPNLVDFESEDDPAKAVNWAPARKWITVALLSSMTLITPLASSMFAPGVPQLLQDLPPPAGENPGILGSFVVSVYVLGYAAGPLVIAPVSEMYGKNPVYHTTNILFVIFTVACAVASSLRMLIGFRLLEGIAGSAIITIGGSTCADLFKQEERGAAMAIWSMGPLMGPVIGPIAGGYLAQAAGWRWVFWVIAIAAGALTTGFFFVLRETSPVAILATKAKKLRKETGNQQLKSAMAPEETATEHFKHSIVRPMRLLFRSPIVFILSTYMAIVYGYLYLLFTTITEVFEQGYQFSQGSVGLTFLGIGIGMFIGLILFGAGSDRVLKMKAKQGKGMKPEHRLLLMPPGAFAIPIGLFIYGWTAQYQVQFVAPIFGTALVGFGLLATFMPITTYLVDAFQLHAASALAAATVFRSTVGALLPLAGPPMYHVLGLGWGNSLLGFIAVALVPTPFLLLKYGEAIRTNRRFQAKW